MRLKYPEMLAIVVHEKKNMLHSLKKMATLGTVAYVAGVKRGRGNLGAQERVGLPRAWSRALIPFAFPFERLPRRL